MIAATRNEALAVLAEVCDLSPGVRLGQLFAHFGVSRRAPDRAVPLGH
jgi:hypothetical protein